MQAGRGPEAIEHLIGAIAEDFAKSFQIWKALEAGIFLGAHGEYYGLVGKYEKWKKGGAGNPFVDPDGSEAAGNENVAALKLL